MMPHPERVVLRSQLSFVPAGTSRITPWMGLFDNAWRFVTESKLVVGWVGVDPLCRGGESRCCHGSDSLAKC